MTIDTTAPLTRAELDRLTCQWPGCDHKDHDDGLYLNARCHMKSPAIVRGWGDGVIEVRCKVCNGFIGSIQTDAETTAQIKDTIRCDDPKCETPLEQHRIAVKSHCHPKAGVFVHYIDGHLHLGCATCKKVFMGLGVAAQGAPS